MAEPILDPDGRFSLVLPAGWQAEPDEDGGLEVWRDEGSGSLHLISFEQGDEVFDPAEELYAFLEDRGVELEEDDVDDLQLPGGADMALCEYVTEEDEEDDEALFWLVGVATTPGTLVFATFFCPAADADRERDAVRELLPRLTIHGGGEGE